MHHALSVRNPRTGECDYTIHPPSLSELYALCSQLRSGQKEWQKRGVEHRIDVLQRWKKSAQRYRSVLEEALITDTGRKWETLLEVDLLFARIDRWCELGKEFFDKQDTKPSHLPFIEIRQDVQPYPLVGVISPWNFPLLLSLIDAIPALVAGCAVLVKPSEITPRFIKPLMQSVFDVPELASVLAYIEGAGETGEAMIQCVDLVCFTGSVATGKRVYTAAAQNFIPVFLELGGKDAALVFEGANLDYASSAILWGATANAGQSCLSIERIYVQSSIYEDFVKRIVKKAEALSLCYPDIHHGHIGPIISERQVSIINDHLRDAIEQGAQVLTGSIQCEQHGGGMWCRPTVLTCVHHGMKVMTEETFGPILPIMPFNTEDEALTLANSTIFGLSGAVFASTVEEAYRIGQKMECGAISLNDAALTAIVHEGEKQSLKCSGIGGTRMGVGAMRRFVRQRAFLAKIHDVPSPWWYNSTVPSM
ncbi:MAG: aldehyde dehydrogenase family protein [Bacteroidota bacterium]|nr:aldehyde dehydrogenase family protein [Candidatus Kapabacteria bacterium]MDW8219220.1 aldehyde dehydrogenase family protein [Bacteroidota bacterium]